MFIYSTQPRTVLLSPQLTPTQLTLMLSLSHTPPPPSPLSLIQQQEQNNKSMVTTRSKAKSQPSSPQESLKTQHQDNGSSLSVSPPQEQPPLSPYSHPIQSLPASQASSPVQIPADFKIPAATAMVSMQELQGKLDLLPVIVGSNGSEKKEQPAIVEQTTMLVEEVPRLSIINTSTIEKEIEKESGQQFLPPSASTTTVEDQLVATMQTKLYVSREDKPLKPLPKEAIPCDKLPDGPEPVVVEIEYPARDDLVSFETEEEVNEAVLDMTAGLAQDDWVKTCGALTLLRRLATHCSSGSGSEEGGVVDLTEVLPPLLKAVRSLRSSLCKTAILTVADMYAAYRDEMLPVTDIGGATKPLGSMLAQLLTKAASNEKKFVVDEAIKTLETVVDSCSPEPLVTMLIPYTEHKNPKVRGKSCTVLALAVSKLAASSQNAIALFGLGKLLYVAAKLVTDNTPEARDGAKKIAGHVKKVFDEDERARIALNIPPPPPITTTAEEGGGLMEDIPLPPTEWERWCKSVLSPSGVLAIMKAVN